MDLSRLVTSTAVSAIFKLFRCPETTRLFRCPDTARLCRCPDNCCLGSWRLLRKISGEQNCLKQNFVTFQCKYHLNNCLHFEIFHWIRNVKRKSFVDQKLLSFKKSVHQFQWNVCKRYATMAMPSFIVSNSKVVRFMKKK